MLNELFAAWVETVYHHRVHSETSQTPIARFTAGPAPALPTPSELRKAFLWSEHRTVTKTATVSLHGNIYEVDAALIGRRVELVFDPFDLAEVNVRHAGRDMGSALPQVIGRHVHPAAKPPALAPAPATGIDYLNLVRARHTTALTQRVNYAAMTDQPVPAQGHHPAPAGDVEGRVLPGQVDLLDLLDPMTDPTPDTQEQ